MVVIGQGTFGKVFLAKMLDNQPPVAIKSLKKTHLIKMDQVEHLRNEKNVLTLVDSPFIVKL
jgi:protein kinase X